MSKKQRYLIKEQLKNIGEGFDAARLGQIF
jgi:hypothetical protein